MLCASLATDPFCAYVIRMLVGYILFQVAHSWECYYKYETRNSLFVREYEDDVFVDVLSDLYHQVQVMMMMMMMMICIQV